MSLGGFLYIINKTATYFIKKEAFLFGKVHKTIRRTPDASGKMIDLICKEMYQKE